MAQFNPGSAQDMQLAVTVQQNLKMCAAAIGQVHVPAGVLIFPRELGKRLDH
jgi:hypothetical protein